MSRNLHGKTIIITGASSGIGAATAIECAKAGMHVVLNARREEKLRQVAEQVERHGVNTAIVVGDVTDEGISERMLDAAEHELGGLYAVFSNAGYGSELPVLKTELDQVRAMFEVNFFASLELVHQAARRLVEHSKPGHLMMCSSCLAKFTMPWHGVYSATKAAQNHLCLSMRAELAAHQIEVSSVHPVTTATEFFEQSARRSGKGNHSDVLDHVPKFLIQKPERVARAVVKCLRRPKPEVWTSALTHTFAAMATFSPRLLDFVMRQQMRKMNGG